MRNKVTESGTAIQAFIASLPNMWGRQEKKKTNYQLLSVLTEHEMISLRAMYIAIINDRALGGKGWGRGQGICWVLLTITCSRWGYFTNLTDLLTRFYSIKVAHLIVGICPGVGDLNKSTCSSPPPLFGSILND